MADHRPIVEASIVAHLVQEGFGLPKVDTSCYPGSRDHEIQVAHSVTFCAGQLSVIEYLRSLVLEENQDG